MSTSAEPSPAGEAPGDGGRRYGGKTAAERRLERREKLIDAGLELFGTRGYAATTIEGICAAARLNARYFYEEFQGREALLEAVYDRHVDSVFSAVVATVEHTPPEPRARLEAALAAFVEGTLADPRAARINYFEMVGVSHALEARRRAVLRAYSDLVAAQIEALLPAVTRPPSNPRMAAVALVGATDGLIIDWLSDPDGADRGQIVSALIELFGAAFG